MIRVNKRGKEILDALNEQLKTLSTADERIEAGIAAFERMSREGAMAWSPTPPGPGPMDEYNKALATMSPEERTQAEGKLAEAQKKIAALMWKTRDPDIDKDET